MARFRPGEYFPFGALSRLKKPRLENGSVVTDSTCEEVREAVFEFLNADLRDFIFTFSLLSTSITLGLLGVFWRTYAIVSDHLIPIGVATYVASVCIGASFGLWKRRHFFKNVILECDDG